MNVELSGWAQATAPDTLKALKDEGMSYLVSGTDDNHLAVVEDFERKLPTEKRAEIERAEARIQEAQAKVDTLQAEHQKVAGKVSGSASLGGVGGLFAFGRSEIQAARENLLRGQGLKIGAVIDSTSFPMGAPIDFRTGQDFPYLSETPIVASLFPQETTVGASVTVYKQTALASGAAAVAAGDTKPTSSPTWEEVDLALQVVAHRTTVDNRILADFRQWEQFIGREMIRGLLAELDSEILSGSGTSPHLAGILGATNSGDIGSVDWDSTNDTRSEAIHKALTYVRNNAFAEATTILIRPDDLELVRFEKASGSGEFMNGEPIEGEIESLWGRRVIATTALPTHTAIVLNPELAGVVYIRQGATLEANPYGEDEWNKNQVSLRAEMRVAFGLINPAAVCEVLL